MSTPTHAWSARGSELTPELARRVAETLGEVIGLVDRDELEATSSERAHLCGARAAAEVLSGR